MFASNTNNNQIIDSSIELVNAEFTSELFENFEPLRRYDAKSGRHYFELNSNGKVQLYPSVTTIIAKTTPTPWIFQDMMAKLGMDGFNQWLSKKANYGTTLHILLGKFFQNMAYDFGNLELDLHDIVSDNRYYNLSVDAIIEDIAKDLLAFIAFAKTHKVKPLALELPVASKVYNFAGTVDMVCELEVEEKGFYGEIYKSGERKDEPKETKQFVKKTAIVDFKSGKSGHFEDHGLQLAMYKIGLSHRYNVQVDAVINVSPKAWRTAPDYNLHDWSNDIDRLTDKSLHLIALLNLSNEKLVPDTVTTFAGVATIDSSPGDVMQTVSLTEYLKAQIKEAK